MRSMTRFIDAVIFAGGVAIGALSSAGLIAQGTLVVGCGPVATPQMRTTLYFGLQRPKGAVSELEWQIFLRDEVTKQFPAGLTVWEAQGQWRTPSGAIDQERSKVLLLVHPDNDEAKRAVQGLVEAYRRTFEQESVLWESARVCVAS
jgi:hypothetical protein